MNMLAKADDVERIRMLGALGAMFGEDLGDVRLEGYLAALGDVPIDPLRLGIQHAIRTCTWLPKPAELRRAVDVALATQRTLERVSEQVVPDHDWRVAVHCLVCMDSGWAYSRKGSDEIVPHALVKGSHADWGVRPCTCRDTNPVIRRRCGERRYSQEPGEGT